jgi:hypothetical protein
VRNYSWIVCRSNGHGSAKKETPRAEFVHENKRTIVVQQEVLSDARSFNRALVHVLRQDPDVIVVGEMRDHETISLSPLTCRPKWGSRRRMEGKGEEARFVPTACSRLSGARGTPSAENVPKGSSKRIKMDATQSEWRKRTKRKLFLEGRTPASPKLQTSEARRISDVGLPNGATKPPFASRSKQVRYYLMLLLSKRQVAAAQQPARARDKTGAKSQPSR